MSLLIISMHTSFPNCICFLYNFHHPVLINDSQSNEDGAREGGRREGRRAREGDGRGEREGEGNK